MKTLPEILIVDDEEKNIKLIKAMLINESYVIEGCLSGEEALKSIEIKKPDLILLDILMPGLNGLESCKMLKNDLRTRIIPIIIVTGLKDRKERETALDAGAEDFLSKPVDRFELTARVKSLIRLKSYHDELVKSYTEIARKNDELANEIKERKKTEISLRQSEERYRQIVNHAPAGICEVDLLKQKFISVNDVMCNFTGYTKEAFLELSPLNLFTKESKSLFIKAQQKIIKGENLSQLSEYKIHSKNGSEIWIMLNSKVSYHQEKPEKVTYVVHDISKLKQAEEEKRKLEVKLQKAQKMEAIGALAGGVAHDLNNILSGVLTYPELLLLELPADHKFRKPIETIKESGKKAAAIVDDLLTMARRGVAISEVVNLNDIISNYLISPEFKKLQEFHPLVRIETNLDTELMNIIGSSIHLFKTIMNLVSNASEAMTNGGLLRISTRNISLDRPIKNYDEVRKGNYVTLEISDTGIGIPPEDIPHLFEPFFTKKKMGRSGTGLGMAVVWGTVKDHKGYIEVESCHKKGTKIRIYFPISDQKIVPDKNDFKLEHYMGNRESVLVVDDEENQREIASMILSQLNYAVATVQSGEEAVLFTKNNKTDLVILDMMMEPGIDGLETYQEILHINPKQKAVITSGFSDTKRIKEVQRIGSAKYIKKPYSIENMAIVVKSFFQPNGMMVGTIN